MRNNEQHTIRVGYSCICQKSFNFLTAINKYNAEKNKNKQDRRIILNECKCYTFTVGFLNAAYVLSKW